MNHDTWCIVMAGRHPADSLIGEDLFLSSLQRASGITSHEKIAAVVADSRNIDAQSALARLTTGQLIVQPEYRGTAFEVLLALLWLERNCEPDSTVVFLPYNHRVADEAAMANSLSDMLDWTSTDPSHVYLLGAFPHESSGAFGYIVPWNDSRQVPASVYEFVESPDKRHALKLINAGALLNTFIFGGALSTMLSLFSDRFEHLMPRMSSALRAQGINPADDDRLKTLYGQLTDTDFSKELLTAQTDKLKVLRMASCGWRPAHFPARVAAGDSLRS